MCTLEEVKQMEETKMEQARRDAEIHAKLLETNAGIIRQQIKFIAVEAKEFFQTHKASLDLASCVEVAQCAIEKGFGSFDEYWTWLIKKLLKEQHELDKVGLEDLAIVDKEGKHIKLSELALLQ